VIGVGGVEVELRILAGGRLQRVDTHVGRLDDGEIGLAPPPVDLQIFDYVVLADFNNLSRLVFFKQSEPPGLLARRALPVLHLFLSKLFYGTLASFIMRAHKIILFIINQHIRTLHISPAPNRPLYFGCPGLNVRPAPRTALL